MHLYKIVAPILLILSLINILLAVPVVLKVAGVSEDVIPVSESAKRSDELGNHLDEPRQKRDSSSGSSPALADQELATVSPPPPPPPPQTGTSRIQDVASAPSPEIKLPLSGDYPSSSEGYPPLDAGSEVDPASNEDTRPAGSIMNQPASVRPEIGSTTRPHPRPPLEPFPWNSHDWSETSSEADPEPTFLSRVKSFFDKLTYKFKFWPRGHVL